VAKQWHLILGQLPDLLAQALAWHNAERVYGVRVSIAMAVLKNLFLYSMQLIIGT
jgi:hypothetical protein